ERYLRLADDDPGGDERRASAREFVGSYQALIQTMHPGVPLDAVLRGEELFQRAFAALQGGRHHEAAEGFRAVVTLLPHHHPSWANLGAAELARGRRDEAARCLRQALRLNIDYVIARENL